jgi:hypothetical protein
MSEVQPARGSDRIKLHEKAQQRDISWESKAFARRRDKRRKQNAIAKASRRKNR